MVQPWCGEVNLKHSFFLKPTSADFSEESQDEVPSDAPSLAPAVCLPQKKDTDSPSAIRVKRTDKPVGLCLQAYYVLLTLISWTVILSIGWCYPPYEQLGPAKLSGPGNLIQNKGFIKTSKIEAWVNFFRCLGLFTYPISLPSFVIFIPDFFKSSPLSNLLDFEILQGFWCTKLIW